MPETAAMPATAKELLAAGEAELREADAAEKQRAADAAAERQARWDKLRQVSQTVFGPLADLVPAAPPDDFSDMQHDYTLDVRPFGGVTHIAARFHAGRDYANLWEPRRGDDGSPELTPYYRSEPHLGDEMKNGDFQYEVLVHSAGHYNLAQAYALCARGERDAKKASAECVERNKRRAEKTAAAANAADTPEARFCAATIDLIREYAGQRE